MNSAPSRNFFTKRLELAKVVGAVAVAEDDVLAPDGGQAVDVRASEAPLGRLEDAGPRGKGQLRRPVGRAVDDEDLGRHPCLAHASWHHARNIGIVSFLVRRRNDDTKLRIGDIVDRTRSSSSGSALGRDPGRTRASAALIAACSQIRAPSESWADRPRLVSRGAAGSPRAPMRAGTLRTGSRSSC